MTGPALPAPLVPADCDLSEYHWFKLHFRRVERSQWWAEASDLARSRNVDLWIAAFQEVPAGSLPDRDSELARRAGFGRDIAGFQAVKAELMAPWRLCADGRWYHPTLAEVVCEAWEGLSETRRKERERKARQRARMREAVPPGEPPVPRDTPSKSRDFATEEKRGEEKRKTVASDGPKRPVGWSEDVCFLQAWSACTRQMRLRSNGRDKTWPIWRRLAEREGGERLLAALRAYLKRDTDVGRTGGPGLHRWLTDQVWSHWLDEAEAAAAGPEDPADKWRRLVAEYRVNGYWPADEGPRPGKPGCRCPREVIDDLAIKERTGRPRRISWS